MTAPIRPIPIPMDQFLNLGTNEALPLIPPMMLPGNGNFGPFDFNGIPFPINSLQTQDGTLSGSYSGLTTPSLPTPSSASSTPFSSDSVPAGPPQKKRCHLRHDPEFFLGPTPDIKSIEELKAFREKRTSYHKNMVIAQRLQIGTPEYQNRLAAAVRRTTTSSIYLNPKHISRSSLFNPDSYEPLPQKVKYPINAQQCYLQWRVKIGNVSHHQAREEWALIVKDFDRFKEWAIIASDLFTEHLVQKEKGYIYVVNKENSRRIRTE